MPYAPSVSYEQIYDWSNLLSAWNKASKGKRGRQSCASFEYKVVDELLLIQQSLREQTYQPGAYTQFHIHEPKRRLISAAPFQDRVVHHAKSWPVCSSTSMNTVRRCHP